MKKSFPHAGEFGEFLFKCLIVGWCILFPQILLIVIPVWLWARKQKKEKEGGGR